MRNVETGGAVAWDRRLRYAGGGVARTKGAGDLEREQRRSEASARATRGDNRDWQTGDRYDLALMGYGQGYAGQMTPFQMALAAAAIGNMEGKLMKPKIEFDRAAARLSIKCCRRRVRNDCGRSWGL